ncbi:hypothetical protein ACLOJK_011733, partial [Asimina triloba]
ASTAAMEIIRSNRASNRAGFSIFFRLDLATAIPNPTGDPSIPDPIIMARSPSSIDNSEFRQRAARVAHLQNPAARRSVRQIYSSLSWPINGGPSIKSEIEGQQ